MFMKFDSLDGEKPREKTWFDWLDSADEAKLVWLSVMSQAKWLQPSAIIPLKLHLVRRVANADIPQATL